MDTRPIAFLRRSIAVLACLSAVVFTTSGAAYAAEDDDSPQPLSNPYSGRSLSDQQDDSDSSDGGADTTTTTRPDGTDSGDSDTDPAGLTPAGDDLRGRYTSLSAALIDYYSTSTGVAVNDFFDTNQTLADQLTGGELADMNLGDFGELQERLSVASFGEAGSFNDIVASIADNPLNADSFTITLGASFAANPIMLPVPELRSPGLLSQSMLSGQVGPESLAFGLFFDQSIANLVTDAPDVFAQVSSSGMLDQSAMDAWNRARAKTSSLLTSGVGSTLPSPCYASMISAMGSGSSAYASRIAPSGVDCSPCISAGQYMHWRSEGLLAPTAHAYLPSPGDGVYSAGEWGNLRDTQRQALGGSSLFEGASGSQQLGSSSLGACNEASAGVSSYLNGSIGSVLDRLGG